MTRRAAGDRRAEVVSVARAMSVRGLTSGRSGNVSARDGDGMWITPSGLRYDRLRADDVVFVDAKGAARGARAPSTEWRLHAAVYAARPDVRAVVHAHSPHATALACARRAIPAFHYMVAIAGGDDVPLVPYATFGSERLAAAAARALRARDACLLANHGQVAVGPCLDAALELAQEVETLARLYALALSAGRPHVLAPREMARVRARLASYGALAERAGSRPRSRAPEAPKADGNPSAS